jgi:hypothetical protein
MTNPFEQLANAQMVAVTRAKHRAAEKRAAKVVKSEKDAPMKLSEMEQKQADQSTQTKLWRAFHRAEVQTVAERHGENWQSLVRVLKGLSLDDGEELIEYIRSQRWLHDADAHTRRVALGLIARAIIRLRQINGLSPFDDSVLDEPPTAFEVIRKELRTQT